VTPLATTLGAPPRVVDDRHERRLAAWRPVRLTSSLGHGARGALLGHVRLPLLAAPPPAPPAQAAPRVAPVPAPAVRREPPAERTPPAVQHARAVLDPAHRPGARDALRAEAAEVARRTSRTPPPRPAPPPPATAPPVTAPAAGAPDDAALDRQARLLYPRVRALLDADLARDRQRAGPYPAGR